MEGIAGMDHESSSSQLAKNLAGWDWTCIQLDDGTELKAYRLRKNYGKGDRWSVVYWIDRDGTTIRKYEKDFSWLVDKTCNSPKTGLSYPTHVTIEANHPERGKLLNRILPLVENQEFSGKAGGNNYWEGACEALDGQGRLIGRAYLEFASYGESIGARLNWNKFFTTSRTSSQKTC